MTLCYIAEDREQWRELVALASMAESSWTMKTWADQYLCAHSTGGKIYLIGSV